MCIRDSTCPTCGRTQYPCTEIANEVEKRLQGCKKSIKVAVMEIGRASCRERV